jgi:hypothetical protein
MELRNTRKSRKPDQIGEFFCDGKFAVIEAEPDPLARFAPPLAFSYP